MEAVLKQRKKEQAKQKRIQNSRTEGQHGENRAISRTEGLLLQRQPWNEFTLVLFQPFKC